jgi:hypothetical protein
MTKKITRRGTMTVKDPILEAAMRAGMNRPPQPVQQVVQAPPLEGFGKLVEQGVITPEQCFNLLFLNSNPKQYLGVKDQLPEDAYNEVPKTEHDLLNTEETAAETTSETSPIEVITEETLKQEELATATV